MGRNTDTVHRRAATQRTGERVSDEASLATTAEAAVTGIAWRPKTEPAVPGKEHEGEVR